jgi:hypothetical protein
LGRLSTAPSSACPCASNGSPMPKISLTLRTRR